MSTEKSEPDNRCHIRVLFVIESLTGGGAEKVLSTIVKLIDKERFYVSVCTVVDTGVYADEVKKHADAYTSILGDPARMGFLRKLWYKIMYKLVYHVLPMRWIYDLFVPHHADVEVAFTEGFVTKLMAASSNLQAKKLAWVHTDFENNHWTLPIYKKLSTEKECYHQFNTVVGVSSRVTSAVERLFRPCEVITLHTPIDKQGIWEQTRAGVPLPLSSGIRLVSVGRFVPLKAYMSLLRIVKRLREQGYLIELWLLGDGTERWKYEEYIAANRLNEVVKLWGFQRNPYPYLKASTLYVCSSEYEGYSTAVHEALIVGIPVVSTDVSGADELLHHGACGLITANDEISLYDGIKTILEHPEKLEKYRANISLFYGANTAGDEMKKIEAILTS